MEYWLDETAKKFPDRLAVLGEQIAITYSELQNQVETTASNLFKITQSLDDSKIAVLLENRLEYIWLVHAFGILDSYPVLINTRLTAEEILWQLTKLNIRAVIVSKETSEKIKHLSSHLQIYSIDDSVPEAMFLALNQQGQDLKKINFSPNKIQSLVFTSGTTGKPKAAIIQYNNILASAKDSAIRLGVQENDVWMLTIPLYHVGGLSILYRSCINGTTIFLDKKFKTERLVSLVSKYNITILSLVPTMLQWLITNNAFSTPTPSLRLILVGGDRVDVDLIESCKKLNLPVALTYGMTETVSQIATATTIQVFKKPLSVGKALNGLKITIINSENTTAKPNELGEVVVTGEAVIDGYYHEVSANFDDFGFRTGDIGFLDDEGDLFILQRRIDLIISGGENIYPSEVEDVLNKIPGIKSTCVLGKDDLEWGQIPVAVIALEHNAALDEDEILTNCRQNLASFKVPKLIYFMDDLPSNSIGKINKYLLREFVNDTEQN